MFHLKINTLNLISTCLYKKPHYKHLLTLYKNELSHLHLLHHPLIINRIITIYNNVYIIYHNNDNNDNNDNKHNNHNKQ
jgi:hypothetical protein